MIKNKNFKNYTLIAISLFFVISCGAEVTAPSTSKTKVTKPPVPTPTPYFKTVKFDNRKQAYEFLKCLIKTDGNDGNPALLERDIDNMEKGNPVVSDTKAIETYTKYVNTILSAYPSTFSGCKDLPYKDV